MLAFPWAYYYAHTYDYANHYDNKYAYVSRAQGLCPRLQLCQSLW